MERTLAQEKSKMQAKLLRDCAGGNSQTNVKETESKMITLIENNNKTRDIQEDIRAQESHAKSPFGSLLNLPARQS